MSGHNCHIAKIANHQYLSSIVIMAKYCCQFPSATSYIIIILVTNDAHTAITMHNTTCSVWQQPSLYHTFPDGFGMYIVGISKPVRFSPGLLHSSWTICIITRWNSMQTLITLCAKLQLYHIYNMPYRHLTCTQNMDRQPALTTAS